MPSASSSNRTLESAGSGSGPGLYVHVPYCARACPYCDFDFRVVGRGRGLDIAGYVASLGAEIEARGLSGTAVRTVYLGGGTPSILGGEGLRATFAALDRHFDRSGALETTVELNPEHVDGALLDALVELGCDRVSLGTQTLETDGLVQLGRMHDGARGRATIEAAAERGLSVSADLIVGWPGQTPAMLDRDVARLVDAGARHLSIYALTIEPGTPWVSLVERGTRAMPDDDHQADLLARVEAWAAAAGWEHYEVASYAASADDRAVHNLGYWTGVDYVGLGPSAASAHYAADGSVTRRTNPRSDDSPGAAPTEEILDPAAAAAEGLWLGLRVLTGLSVSQWLGRFPAVDEAWLDARIERCVRRGDLERSGDHLRIAPGRWLHHDSIAVELLTL